MQRKRDDAAIGAFLDTIVNAPWLMPRQCNWPRFLFHLTDVHNAASILSSGRLVCRSLAIQQGLMVVDNASPSVIGNTSADVHTNVRLYFRPRTPTFFRNEGIRPVDQRADHAHCPMPIAFLFDAQYVLGLESTRFTDGAHNRWRQLPRIGQDVEFLRHLPWQTILDDRPPAAGRPSEAEQREKIYRRHAEVHVPWELPLVGLRHVFARSPAERETLETLLGTTTGPCSTMIRRVRPDNVLFVNRWTYVERVTVIDGRLRITFNTDTETPGPFTFQLRYSDRTGQVEDHIELKSGFSARSPLNLPVPDEFRTRPFRLTLTLDDSLAYMNEFDPTIGKVQLIG